LSLVQWRSISAKNKATFFNWNDKDGLMCFCHRVRWHRAGFRRYWSWKSQRRGGRPPISADLRTLIWRMSLENVLWGAPRIQGELLKLGFAVAQSTVAKYMSKRDNSSGQRWGTFLRNHALGAR
jgi:hypothetical protein